jgi:hypothetical protein
MDKVQKPSNSEVYRPYPEPFRIQSVKMPGEIMSSASGLMVKTDEPLELGK